MTKACLRAIVYSPNPKDKKKEDRELEEKEFALILFNRSDNQDMCELLNLDKSKHTFSLTKRRFYTLIERLLQFGKLEYTDHWKAEKKKAIENGGYTIQKRRRRNRYVFLNVFCLKCYGVVQDNIFFLQIYYICSMNVS
jgi:hypothetical protein